MKRLIFVLTVAAAFIIEKNAAIFGIRPNLTLLLVYSYGLRNGHTKGLFFGAFLGAVSDGLSGWMLGPAMLGKGTVGFMSFFLTRGFFRWTPFLGFLGITSMTLLDGALEFSALSVFGSSPTAVSNAFYLVLGQAALNASAGLFIRPRHEY